MSSEQEAFSHGPAVPRENRRIPGTDILRLQTLSNLIFGRLTAWALLILSALFYNRSALTGPDRSPPYELAQQLAFFFLLSVAVDSMIARPCVSIGPKALVIRNAWTVWTVDRRADIDVQNGFFGWLIVRADGRRIRVLGIQETVRPTMSWGSEVRALLEAELEQGAVAAG